MRCGVAIKIDRMRFIASVFSLIKHTVNQIPEDGDRFKYQKETPIALLMKRKQAKIHKRNL